MTDQEQEEVVSKFKYNGENCIIKRVEVDHGPYAYEFEAYVNGNLITTASQIEEKGYSNPWIPALKEYLKEEHF